MFDSDVDTLTPRQREVFEAVRSHLAAHGYPPTVREIGEQLGLTSTSTVHAHLAAIERAGLLRRDPAKPRALTLADGHEPQGEGAAGAAVGAGARTSSDAAIELPLVGRVAAGEPLLAEEHVEEYLPVPALLARRGESFLLRIRGDSMTEAGILDGDYVVVRRQDVAEDGEVVVALVDDEPEATCKRLRRTRDGLELVAEHPTMAPIRPRSCQVIGVVTGVFRAL